MNRNTKILSIDLGSKAIAYCFLDNSFIEYNIINIPKNSSGSPKGIIEARVDAVNEIFNDFRRRFHPKIIKIEQQVISNVVCMSLMYSVVTWCRCNGIPFVVESPKTKFNKFNIAYNSSSKAHKKLSVKLAKYYLNERKLKNNIAEFSKADDISDCILMCLNPLV